MRFKQVGIVEILLFIIITTFVISLEGGILSTIMITKFDFQEDKEVMTFLVSLMRQQVPLFFSSFLSRIPLNFLDKGISVIAAWGMFLGYIKFNRVFPDAILFRSQNLK